jgi:mannose-1-phosphate guanylyltransferase
MADHPYFPARIRMVAPALGGENSAMEAIILVGGQGTRLRPLTITTPKPMLPLAGIPFITHQLLRCRQAGIEHVVLATSYRSEVFTRHFGDGDEIGLALTYAVEDEPLGTGGALRNAAAHLRDTGPVVVLNGDVLGGLDLRRLTDRHRQTGADVTLHLREVPDPSAYGVVTTRPDGRVTAFREKTTRPSGNQVNAGTYVFSRAALLAIPPGRVVSVERETFPGMLRGQGHLAGMGDQSYWLDIGTPAAYRRANCDLVQGRAPSAVPHSVPAESLILTGARVARSASLAGGSVVGRDAEVEGHARLSGSVVFDGATVGTGARIEDSVIGRGARIGAGAVLSGAMIADGVTVPARARIDAVAAPLAS